MKLSLIDSVLGLGILMLASSALAADRQPVVLAPAVQVPDEELMSCYTYQVFDAGYDLDILRSVDGKYSVHMRTINGWGPSEDLGTDEVTIQPVLAGDGKCSLKIKQVVDPDHNEMDLRVFLSKKAGSSGTLAHLDMKLDGRPLFPGFDEFACKISPTIAVSPDCKGLRVLPAAAPAEPSQVAASGDKSKILKSSGEPKGPPESTEAGKKSAATGN
ncbi:MAG: hypothetical protein ACXWPM_05150 [Bdellovibrionota bacterium]